jgi:hypothetical protein
MIQTISKEILSGWCVADDATFELCSSLGANGHQNRDGLVLMVRVEEILWEDCGAFPGDGIE